MQACTNITNNRKANARASLLYGNVSEDMLTHEKLEQRADGVLTRLAVTGLIHVHIKATQNMKQRK